MSGLRRHDWRSKVKRKNGRHKGFKTCACCGISVLEMMPVSMAKGAARGERYTIFLPESAGGVVSADYLPPCRKGDAP